jgi:hypothetical protein
MTYDKNSTRIFPNLKCTLKMLNLLLNNKS